MATINRLPKTFVAKHVTLSWSDMLYGLEHGLLDETTVQEFAIDKVAPESGPESPELRIAVINRGCPAEVRDVLIDAANGEDDESSRDCGRKWCFLVLQWLFEHREDLADPLADVENVYADLGYPAEVAAFVTYETGPIGADESVDPRARLFGRWAAYLAKLQAEFGPRRTR